VEKKKRFAGDFDRHSLRHGSALAAEFDLQNVRSMNRSPEKSPCKPHGKFLDFLGAQRSCAG
jgi:hypothetical protein